MASQKFKLPLNAAQFPFLYAKATRSVLQPGLDLAPRTSQGFFGGPASADYNLLQALFVENVLPLATGLVSVGYREEIPAISPAATDFDQLMVLRDANELQTLFCPARGKNYVYKFATNEWTSYSSFTFNAAYSLVTKAYVGGRTLVCYESTKVIEWDAITPEFDTVTLTLPSGYAITDIRGICGASNYLIAFTDLEILWSSLLDITDFDDSAGGSGRQTPIDIKGQIVACYPIAGGFMIYTTQNVVSAQFTNNTASPFLFREVPGSGGYQTAETITGDSNSTGQYAYGTAGLQLLSMQRADSVLPDAADFLTGQTFEEWNSTLGVIELKNVTLTRNPKLVMLANRYLMISYAWVEDHYTQVLVYDLVLARWGKLRIDHVDVGILPETLLNVDLRYYQLGQYDGYTTVGYNALTLDNNAIAALRRTFIFLKPSGATNLLVLDDDNAKSIGVVLFGRVQVTRNRTVTLHKVTLEGVFDDAIPVVKALSSRDGYRRDAVDTLMLSDYYSRYATFAGRFTAENIDISLEGHFDLTSAIVETVIHGAR